jgi:hypothetical protein
MAYTYVRTFLDDRSGYFYEPQLSDARTLTHSHSFENGGTRTMPPFSFLSYENVQNKVEPFTNETGHTYSNIIEFREPVTITIRAYGAGKTLITEKRISNVDILKNRTVRYTGHLFENAAFDLSVDDAWELDENTF